MIDEFDYSDDFDGNKSWELEAASNLNEVWEFLQKRAKGQLTIDKTADP